MRARCSRSTRRGRSKPARASRRSACRCARPRRWCRACCVARRRDAARGLTAISRGWKRRCRSGSALRSRSVRRKRAPANSCCTIRASTISSSYSRSCADVYNFSALLGAKRTNAMLRNLGKPIRTVLQWQLAATAAMTIAAALLAGAQTAVSAAAGGLVSVVAGLASAFVASRSDAKSAGEILFGALRAEAVKVAIAVLLLWLVLANYAEAVVGVFVGAFIVTMLIFAMAFFVRDY